MKKFTLTLILLTISFLSNAQVAIPDANFEGALVTYGMDTDGVVNGQISTTDALAITNLSIDNLGIADLTGVNSMTNLTFFSCWGNNLTSVNLQLPNLTTLYIDNNANLSTLDLTGMPQLEILNARNCNLSAIIPNTNYTYTEVRLSNNAFIGNIDLTNLSLATIIDFSNNPISSIDVTGLTNLDFLAVDNCSLTDLDLTTNTNLTNLTAIGNDLTCLDLSQNTLLTNIEVNNNASNLVIVVANVTDANASTGIYQNWYKDTTAIYGTSCGTASSEDFTTANNLVIYPNPIQDDLHIKIAQNADYAIFDLQGKLLNKGTLQNGNNLLDTHTYKQGIYFIKISNSSNILTKKIFIK